MINFGNAHSIMHIGVAYPGSGDANQNVGPTDLGNWNFKILQRLSDLSEPYCSHRLLHPPPGFSVGAKHRMKSLRRTVLKKVLNIRHKSRVEDFFRVRPPLLCAL